MTNPEANLNDGWAHLAIRALTRSGVGWVVLCPGARSSPLALAAGQPDAPPLLIHTDERGAAYLALGHARATGRPAAVITTSGTAVLNLVPAAGEADRDGVPLLFLTADRPPELRDTGANQTTNQVDAIKAYARLVIDLPPPDADSTPRTLHSARDRALQAATGAPPGPVHVNFLFRDPLTGPVIGAGHPVMDHPDVKAWSRSEKPCAAGHTSGPDGRGAVPPEEVIRALHTRPGVISVGQLSRAASGAAICALAEHLRWPVLPDIRSPLRLGNGASPVLPYADLVLASDAFRRAHPAEVVLHFGRLPVSRRWLRYLEESRPVLFAMACPDPRRLDPLHAVTHRFVCEEGGWAKRLHEALPAQAGPDGRLQEWRAAGDAVEDILESCLCGSDAPAEKPLARAVSRLLPAGHGLFLGNSMPVRDMDMVGTPRPDAVPVEANRGVSGIDGQVATAVGWAVGRGGPVTAIVGDLGMLHDLNSLELLSRSPVPVVLIVVNNDGGGIFSLLPVAAQGHAEFDRLFGTPHGRTFHEAAAMFGLPYACPQTRREFERAYRTAVDSSQSWLLEIRTDREESRRQHEALMEALNEHSPTR